MNIDKLIEFYNNNKNTIDLIAATALISSLITWLFTKFLPGISQSANKISEKIIQKIGGQLAYRHIQGKYLNWVILHNQDLNLTGIIGAGQKPRLEQIFISLKVTKDSLQEHDQTKELVKKLASNNSGRIRIWINNYWATVNEYLSKVIKTKPRDTNLQHIFFNPQKNWGIQKLFSRDRFLGVYIFIFFVFLPILGLTLRSQKENLFSAIFYFLFSLSIIFGIIRYREYNEKLTLFFYIIIPTLIIAIKLLLLKYYATSPLYLLLGVSSGCLLIFIAFRNELFPPKHNNERSAEEVGILLSSSDNIAILGKPGSGKSTYSQFIALTFAQEKASNKKHRRKGIVKSRFNINEWYLPILIPLRKVSKFINPSTIHSDKNICIEAFKQDVLPANVREIFSDSFIRYMLSKGKCILLLDGLDEVSNEEHFRLIVNEIKGMVSQYPKNKFLITSRHAGWRGGIGSAFQTSEVNELNDDQITTFAYSWYESIELNRQNENTKMDDEEKSFRENRARSKAEQLVEAVDENENIRNLARNPLLLSMICYVHYNKTLPKERLSLYDDCSRLLLEQWDIEKGLPQDDIPLKYPQKEKIMQEIAYAMHTGKTHNGSGLREITANEIISIIGTVISGFKIDPNQSEIFFKKLIERTGLIISTEQYKNLYGFSHLTFQEFYTAKYLSRNNINIFTEIDSNTPESQERLSSWWREVIILQSGMIKDISEIIGSLCCNTEQDHLGYRIQIAAQCLADSVEIPDIESESLLLRELLRIRSLGEIKEHKAKINSLGKKYLLAFASNWQFHSCTLKTRVKEITKQDEANNFARELLKLAISPSDDIAFGAIDALLLLAKSFDISTSITQDIIKDLIDRAGISNKAVSIFELIDHIGLSPSEKILTAVSESYLKPLFNELAVNYSGSLNNEDGFCKTLMIIKQKLLINNKIEIREYIINTLSKIFTSAPSYRTEYDAVRLSLRNFITCLFHFMISIEDNETVKESIKSQLLNMAYKGTPNQSSWAILILGELFKSDKTIFKTINNLLFSPNKSIRLSAISAMRKLELDKDDINIIKTTYMKAIVPKTGMQNFVLVAIEVILGKGYLGSSRAERIQIAGSLLSIDNTLRLENLLKHNTWSDIYDYKYEWEEMLRDTNWALNNTDIERISKDLLKILSDPDNSVDFVDNIFSNSDQIHEQLKNNLVQFLYDDPHGGAIGFLSTFNPKIEIGSREYEVISSSFKKDYWPDADGAYDILEDNKLIEKTFFE